MTEGVIADRFFISDDKKHIAKLELIGNKCNIYIWETQSKNGEILYHPEDYNPDYASLWTGCFSEKEIAMILKNYQEYDPDVVDHNDPKTYFTLDIGGEG